ncbi:MAG: PASTA domain-containing protein [Clostridiaceae bacterium]|nr:PASTA domain-containing protein [Clostridiaceae bacterium]
MAGPGLLIKKRLLIILMAYSFIILALLFRVGWLQIVEGSKLQEKAFEQHNRDREITPRRGSIRDRNGKDLATSITVERIVINPQEITSEPVKRDQVAQKLAEILELNKEDVLKKINKKNSSYEIIKKRVDKEKGDQIRLWRTEQAVSGIYIDEDTKRVYPNGNLASHIVGFVGEDNQGLGGMEIMMESELKGVPGMILSEKDARGRQMPFYQEKRIDPQDGLNVVLTIDETIQYFANKAIDKAIDDNKVADGAVAIVMDPRNGDILAMVSKPDFDLNQPRACPPGEDPATWKGTTNEDIEKLAKTVWRNKCVSDTYEPGSTFKAITTAAGFEEGVVTPETMTSDKTITVLGKNIDCWKPNFHGTEPFREAVYNSCNPAFVKVALDLGVDKFYKYLRAFGFYEKTGLPLPGEAVGQFHAKPTELDMATASFGQRFTCTPIQLITAYGAIANGGTLMKPRLIKELVDDEGNVVKKYEPQAIRNVISKQTSDTLRDVLEGVVSVGTGKNAYVKGYRVAGKTGTSQTTVNGVYVASFSAFAPAANPVVCVLVALFNPKGDTYYGGQIAAPVAGKIVEDTLNYLEVEMDYTDQDKKLMLVEVAVPDIRDKTVAQAQAALKELELDYIIEGDSVDKNTAIVKEQMPKPGARISKKSVVILYTYKPDKEVMVKVPDLSNKTIDEAVETLGNLGLNVKVNGLGTAVGQSVEAGKEVPKGNVVEVEFRFFDTD